ncbi:hypothetical protein [Galbitalea soli]|uniref:Nucleotidyltransferase family protein n=1 Tax=Galbitalea soli TaxID=1268042 RepID=A0A7C9PMW0_9MICO|nr:hypothetical protein [Galbitalea soli]NEM90989.1 hypothetical protein [Galbitalea soli]NYJ29676.1 hypothetical protein [Galbitalea soli]
MDPTSASIRRAPDAVRRDQKDQIILRVAALTDELRMRSLAAGGSVLTSHGIITPRISPTVSFVVDPGSVGHLAAVLRERGWHTVSSGRRRLLPSMRLALGHPDFAPTLSLFSVLPGFFADPEDVFDLMWDDRSAVRVRGTTVRALSRLFSAILAVHDSLDGRLQRGATHFDFFAEQFSRVLSAEERARLGAVVKRAGACMEMRPLLISLGVEPCPFVLPSDEYVRWRLQTATPTDQARRLVALVDLPRGTRRQLYRLSSSPPLTPADVVRNARELPRTIRTVRAAHRRWHDDEVLGTI